jgi:hypothetical protein
MNQTSVPSRDPDQESKEQAQENTGEKRCKDKKTGDIVIGIVIEAALIFWMLSELAINVDQLRRSSILLLSAILIVLAWMILNLREFGWFHRFRKAIWRLFVVTSLAAFCFMWKMVSSHLEDQRLAKEPKVLPSRVPLHENGFDRLNRVLIENPGDSWAYNLFVLVRPLDPGVPIGAVETHLANPESVDTFPPPKPADPAGPALTPDWGFDVGGDSGSARLLVLYSLGPRQHRALWIMGHTKKNAWAEIDLLEYSKAALSIPADTNGHFFWPGPKKTSTFWKYLPGINPVDFDIDMKVNDPNPPTNAAGSLFLPPRPQVPRFR